MNSTTPKTPHVHEWDFSTVSEGEIHFCLAWEFARESKTGRPRIERWLDDVALKGKSIRQHLRDGSYGGLLNLDCPREAQHFQKLTPPIRPISWTLSQPPNSDPAPHVLLHGLLANYGHYFPKPWPSLPAAVHKRLAKEAPPRGKSVSLMPASVMPLLFATPRPPNSVASLKRKLERSWTIDVDFCRATKDEFMAEVGAWFDRESKKLGRRVRGQAGRLPFTRLKELAAARLFAVLTAPQAYAFVCLYCNPSDIQCQCNAKAVGITAAPKRKLPRDFIPMFELPDYQDKSGWSDASSKAVAELARFESEVFSSP